MHPGSFFLKSLAKISLIVTLLYVALGLGAMPVMAFDASAPTAAAKSQPFVALIIPTKNKAMRPYAEAIRAGVSGAEKVLGSSIFPPVRVYETEDQPGETVDQYLKAWQSGAVGVIGPLSRTAVNELAESVSSFPIPVLALNQFDEQTPTRPGLYSLSLSSEIEAADVARLIANEGHVAPVIIVGDGTLYQRMATGFSQAWRQQKGNDPVVIPLRNLRNDRNAVAVQLGSSDTIFLAMDNRNASRIRPYLGNNRPVYATSQIDPGVKIGARLMDLAGVRYFECPWLDQPDAPEYASYMRVRSASNDVERFYALGADAWRVVQALILKQDLVKVPGLSGWLTIGRDGVVIREMNVHTVAAHMAIPAILPEAASAPAAAPRP